jgi:hypothetical protein
MCGVAVCIDEETVSPDWIEARFVIIWNFCERSSVNPATTTRKAERLEIMMRHEKNFL